MVTIDAVYSDRLDLAATFAIGPATGKVRKGRTYMARKLAKRSR
jgi:hypothetical protein